MLQTRPLLAGLALALALAGCLVAGAADQTEPGAASKQQEQAKETKKTATTSGPPAAPPAGQPQQNATARGKQQGRAGRMLDLDHLAGDIGKDEKVARARQMSGDRQSRILADDLFLTGPAAPKKAASGKSLGGSSKKAKKMSISGFIPIVSLEQAASGKLLAADQDADDDDEATQDEQQQPAANLMSSYGSHTSLGHATFVGQASQQLDAGSVDRAGRRAPPPGADTSANYYPLRQPTVHRAQPANPFPLAQADQQQDCVCVPFYQCRNGYLSESQLSRGQVSQLMPAHQQHMQHPAQVPRALGASATSSDLYNSVLQAKLHAANSPYTGPTSDQQQALNNEFIYEQLKKTIESENLEQAAAYQPLDERSAGAATTGAQGNGNGNATSGEAGVLARNILNPLLGLRSPQRSCGIMRTCCRFPTGHQLPQQQPVPLPSNLGPNFQALRPLRQQRPLLQQQQQLLQQHSLAAPVRSQRPPPMTSTLVDQQQQFSHLMGGAQVAPAGAGQHPPGSFMQGRCGLRPTLGISGRVQNQQGSATGDSGADFGEFPSHAALLKRLASNTGDSLFICSAVLVSNQWLVTAAHCVKRLHLDELKVRLGEWDVSRDDEFYPFLESNVREIIIHPEFQPSSLINDVAMLRLESPLDPQQMPHITPACLATPDELFDGQRCWLTGWGKDAFGAQGTFQSVLKKVDLPVMDRRQCEQALRHQTKLGPYFRLHQSAMCAGGERGKDACEGDGGSGLYCTEPQSGLVKVAGLVSWGVGCGLVGVPGVYTNLARFYQWIEQVAANSGEDSLYTDRNAAQSIGLPADAFKNIISERSNSGAHTHLHNTTSSAPINKPTTPNNNNSNNATLAAIPTATVEEVEARTG